MPNPAELKNNWLKARRERALRLLASREHSQAELTAKLLKPSVKEQAQPKGLPSLASRQEMVENLIDELLEQNYLSNERFIASLTNKILRQGKGPLAFKLACQEHQLENSLVAAASAKLDALWAAQLARVLEKKFGANLPSEQKAKAKAQRFLASRGFTASQIQTVFNN